MLAPNRTSLHSFSTSVFDPHFRFVFGDDSTEKEFRLIIIRLCSRMCNFSIKRYFSWKIFLNQTVLTIFLFICVNLNVPVKPQKYCLGSKLLHIWTKNIILNLCVNRANTSLHLLLLKSPMINPSVLSRLINLSLVAI